MQIRYNLHNYNQVKFKYNWYSKEQVTECRIWFAALLCIISIDKVQWPLWSSGEWDRNLAFRSLITEVKKLFLSVVVRTFVFHGLEQGEEQGPDGTNLWFGGCLFWAVPKPSFDASHQYAFYGVAAEACRSHWRYAKFFNLLRKKEALVGLLDCGINAISSSYIII